MTSPSESMTTTEAPAKPKLTLDFTKAHTVYKNAAGKRVPGVTTILGVINKPYLVKWANTMGLQGIDTEKFVRDAADKGTVAHALVQCHLEGKELDYSNLAPDVVTKAENAFIKFLQWWDAQCLKVVHSELAMISEEWQVGGTGDIFARRQSNGNLVYVDLKTSKGIYPEMRIQSSAYADIYEQNNGVDVNEVWILRTGKEDDETFEPVEVCNREECVTAFVAANDLYRALKKVA